MPFKLIDGIDRVEDTPVREALREVLANCLIHADYYGTRGLVIVRAADKITASNPGGLRISVSEALCGGISDPRNIGLIKMFNLINIGERAGSGIPSICAAWEKQGWENPMIEEQFNPDRTILSLLLLPLSGDGVADKPRNGSNVADIIADKLENTSGLAGKITKDKKAFLEHLAVHFSDYQWITNVDARKCTGLADGSVKRFLRNLTAKGILVASGANKSRKYRLNIDQ